MCIENKLVDNWLNLHQSLVGLSWPLYIGGQVSRNRLGSIQIILFVYDISHILIVITHGPTFYPNRP
jgi:hypothetical protein